MTGLNPVSDTILSTSCILTTSDLVPLDSNGYNAIIHHTPDQLNQMSDWCIKTHGQSGLTQQCLSSTTTAQTAAKQLFAYVKHFIPEPRRALLAGNSIHADKAFLMAPPWDIILEHLHYRLFDVSAMKEMVRRWASDQVLLSAPRKELRHTAREDVLESIQEARYYKTLIENMSLNPSPTVDGQTHASSRRARTNKNMFVVTPSLLTSASAPGVVEGRMTPSPIASEAPMPGPRSQPGQEAVDMLRQNGTQPGEVGSNGDQGFRTDVP